MEENMLYSLPVFDFTFVQLLLLYFGSLKDYRKLFSSESCKPPMKSVKFPKQDINVRSESTYKIHASLKEEPPSASAIAIYHLESSQLVTVVYVTFPVSKDDAVVITILNQHAVFLETGHT